MSWNIVMGIGQVVALRLPASRLREVDRAYHAEFYATYDYKAIGIGQHGKPDSHRLGCGATVRFVPKSTPFRNFRVGLV